MTRKKHIDQEDVRDGEETAEAAFTFSLGAVAHFAQDTRLQHQRQKLAALFVHPPKVLLLEGGDRATRYGAGLYWSCLLGCLHEKKPCFACSYCKRVFAQVHRDFFLFDGSVESIKIQEVRDTLGFLGEAPREAPWRILFFHEAQNIMEAAANALLKSLEDPRGETLFILGVPQRERLLATIVSRSSIVTLPWPSSKEILEAMEQSLDSVLPIVHRFLQSGTGLFALTSNKSFMTSLLVNEFLAYLRCVLSLVAQEREGYADFNGNNIRSLLCQLKATHVRILDELIATAQESLIYGVAPALVFEWLLSKMYLLLQALRK